ncbi:MAG: helix-turn-helix domain-containing protein [Micrococcales bacterium]|nr:helix-turn-helix domain-containing protein [Micrococcales bacterium]
MTLVLEQDAKALRRALQARGDRVSVSVSRPTAEILVSVVEAQAAGQRVVVTQGQQEVTTTQAAKMLGMSRPQVGKLLDQGKLPFRLVGTHHRIPVAAIQAFLAIESKRQHAAMAELIALQNELGLTE